MHPHQGWPSEDFDIIGNEGAIPSGNVDNVYKPQGQFLKNEEGRLSVDIVKWLTVLRHPYTRTMSHYQHVHRLKMYENLTLETFLTEQTRGGFADFIDNQQTRWHCGTGSCVNAKKSPYATKDMLDHAIQNLHKMHAVLILEQMSSPQSCTRRQMRHVLNFTMLESFSDDKADNVAVKATQRFPTSNWEKSVRPHLDRTGRSSNLTALHTFGSNHSNSKAIAMAALGLHNDLDMQLYGYALHLCEVLADQYDRQANATLEAARSISIPTPINITTTTNVTPANNVLEGYVDVDDLPKFFTIYSFIVVLMLVICRQCSCRRTKAESPRSNPRLLPTQFSK